MNQLTFQQKYDSIGRQDHSLEGLFFTGVKTTGIFCRPSCRARKPRKENVIFFDTAKSAIQHGYRPCKICKPMEKLDETPGYVQELIKEVQTNPDQRITDQELTNRGLEPNHIRRWFKKHHQMTFHAYQRMIRINAAYQDLTSGKSVLNSALDSGFVSLSGFNESYKSIFGEPPSTADQHTIIHITRLTTDLGPMFACATANGICLLEFTDRKMLPREFKDLRKRLNAVILPGENPHLHQLKNEISEYYQGNRKKFDLALDAPGTDFQQSVWKVLRDIPYGQTCSYQEQANALGKPRAVRAVASANGHNRIAIIIPCHRVIGSDGSLVGYGGGLYRKQWLLEFERQNR